MLVINIISAPFRFPLLAGNNWCSMDSVRLSGRTFRLRPHDRTLFDATSDLRRGKTAGKVTSKSGLYSYHIAINLQQIYNCHILLQLYYYHRLDTSIKGFTDLCSIRSKVRLCGRSLRPYSPFKMYLIKGRKSSICCVCICLCVCTYVHIPTCLSTILICFVAQWLALSPGIC